MKRILIATIFILCYSIFADAQVYNLRTTDGLHRELLSDNKTYGSWEHRKINNIITLDFNKNTVQIVLENKTLIFDFIIQEVIENNGGYIIRLKCVGRDGGQCDMVLDEPASIRNQYKLLIDYITQQTVYLMNRQL